MGYASSAYADTWSIFNNVAGLGRVKQFSSSLAYEIQQNLVDANRMALSIASPSSIGSFGLGIFRFGNEIYNEHLVSLAAANQIGNTALGIKTNYVQYRSEGFGTSSALSVDFGGLTQITPRLFIGAYINNLTQSRISMTDGERLPTKLVAGFGYRASDGVFIGTELEKDIDYEATWRSGLEYTLYKRVFFRTGFNLNPTAAYFGLGVQKKRLKFDYAIKFNKGLGLAYQISTVCFLSSKVWK
jgi:hypothetical protein